MTVDQSQVDSILAGASADNPEVKLQNLEQEVDLLKKSIKKLLIDIREQMNIADNPLTVISQGGEMIAGLGPNEKARIEEIEKRSEDDTARITELEETVEDLLARLEELGEKSLSDKHKKRTHQPEEDYIPEIPAQHVPPPLPTVNQAPPRVPDTVPAKQAGDEKLRLHKAYHLFNWTKAAITKYGHDRLDIMLDSYRSMGYINKEATDEVKEIARIMPASLGEEHEVGADEFISEIYILNHILDPDDISLDRDMITVMMERDNKMSFSKKPKIPREELGEEWVHLIDKI